MLDKFQKEISSSKFLITGGAGFIGSNLVQYLMESGAKHVRVLDNLSNGYFDNIKSFISHKNFEFIEGDVRDFSLCKKIVHDIDYISHQAALGSVPRSIKDPILTNDVNINGQLNILVAARDSKSVKRLVYAASSSSYGDSKDLPKIEGIEGKPLSPYAITKWVNEMYGDIFSKIYGFHTIGLRYFNVFGPKQNPNNPYAAVIPLFIKAAINNEQPIIYGDGSNSRDFTFVSNAVQANIRALLGTDNLNCHDVVNIAVGERTSIIDLWKIISQVANSKIQPNYISPRIGDIPHSLASIEKAKKLFHYYPEIGIQDGIKLTYDWFVKTDIDLI